MTIRNEMEYDRYVRRSQMMSSNYDIRSGTYQDSTSASSVSTGYSTYSNVVEKPVDMKARIEELKINMEERRARERAEHEEKEQALKAQTEEHLFDPEELFL